MAITQVPKLYEDPLTAAHPAYTSKMVFSVATQKGGVGKTTTSITLAAGLARRGQKVLLLDIDHQANSSKVLVPDYQDLRKEDTIYVTLIERQPLPIRPSSVPNLDIVPSHILVSNADTVLSLAKDPREARLKRQLATVKDEYDYVIIDCPPAINWTTINALTASDGVMVVVAPGYFELDSIVQFGNTVGEVREFYNPNIRVMGYLFTNSDPTNNSEMSLRILRQTYGDQVFKTVIPRNTDIRDAHFNKQDIFVYNPHSKSAEAYQRLIEELFA